MEYTKRYVRLYICFILSIYLVHKVKGREKISLIFLDIVHSIYSKLSNNCDART